MGEQDLQRRKARNEGSESINAGKPILPYLRLVPSLTSQTWEEHGIGRSGVEAGVEAFGRAYEADEPRNMMEAFFTKQAQRKGR